MNQKKVMVYAYTRYNFGDDLLIRILCERYPGVRFLLYTYPEYEKVLSNCKNLTICSNGSVKSKLINLVGRTFHHNNYYEYTLARKCDAAVCITGSLFIQGSENWQPYLEYMKSRQVAGVPFFQIGSNFGPYTDPAFYEGFRDYFQNCQDVCFREKYSYDLFSDLKNVRWAADVAFSGDYSQYQKPSEKRVSVSLIDLENRSELKHYQEHYLEYLEQLCRGYLSKGYIIDLMSFCKAEGDEKAVAELAQRLPSGSVEKHLYHTDTNLDEMLTALGRAEIVVATRFHAMIVGWCLGKKVLPVIYSNKTLNVLRDLLFPGFIDIKTIDSRVTNATMPLELPNAEDAKRNADLQFKRLDCMLERFEKC